MSKLIGYARVSTHDQNVDLQINALNAAGCQRVYCDEGVSGSRESRPELDKLLKVLRQGDTLVVWRLDRLGRSTRHLSELVTGLEKRGVQFRSLTEGMDTSTSTGKLVFHVMASIAEFERDLIRDRTNAGLEAARARGHFGGRKRTISDERISAAKTLSQDKTKTIAQICNLMGISRATYYRLVKGVADA